MVGDRRVSIDEAARRLGQAMWGSDWIEAITPRETWLIEHYVEGRGYSLASQPTWIIAGSPWARHPGDPALAAEVERARDRRDWREAQWDQAYDWLDEQGFDLDAVDVGEDALKAAMAKRWPAKPVALLRDLESGETSHVQAEAIAAPSPEESPLTDDELDDVVREDRGQVTPPTRRAGRPPKYDWDTIKNKALELMDYHGEFRADDPEWNAQARLEEKLLEFCSDVFGSEPEPSALRDPRHIRKWLAEWREGRSLRPR